MSAPRTLLTFLMVRRKVCRVSENRSLHIEVITTVLLDFVPVQILLDSLKFTAYRPGVDLLE